MRVLLADDHELVREGLRVHLQALMAGLEMSEAGSCAEVLAFADRGPTPDLILLDLWMPGMAGMDAARPDALEGLRKIVTAFPRVPVIVVSGYADAATVTGSLKCGARGFVPKSSGIDSLLEAVRRVLTGDIYVPRLGVEEPGATWYSTPREAATDDDPLGRVSIRESTVLQLLTRGLTNKEIALRLGLKEITVKVHLQHAYRKIGASNRADAVRIILQARHPEERMAVARM